MVLTNENFKTLIVTEFKKFMHLALPNEEVELIFSTEDNKPELDQYALFVSALGDMEGILVICTDADTISTFVNKMSFQVAPDPCSSEFNNIAKGYIGEFANILMGKLLGFLEIKKEDVELTTPSIINGQNMKFTLPYSKSVQTSFSIKWGFFNLLFYYET